MCVSYVPLTVGLEELAHLYGDKLICFSSRVNVTLAVCAGFIYDHSNSGHHLGLGAPHDHLFHRFEPPTHHPDPSLQIFPVHSVREYARLVRMRLCRSLFASPCARTSVRASVCVCECVCVYEYVCACA